MSSGLRELIITLPEPISLNNLIRMSYHLRNQRREMLKKLIADEVKKLYGVKTDDEGRLKWKPLKFVRADAIVTLASLRDDFELPACLKIEMDAAQEVGAILSDDPRHLVRGTIAQKTGSARGVRIRFTELEKRPEQPSITF